MAVSFGTRPFYRLASPSGRKSSQFLRSRHFIFSPPTSNGGSGQRLPVRGRAGVLEPRKPRLHQGLRRYMDPRCRLSRRSRWLELNQCRSLSYFQCNLWNLPIAYFPGTRSDRCDLLLCAGTPILCGLGRFALKAGTAPSIEFR